MKNFLVIFITTFFLMEIHNTHASVNNLEAENFVKEITNEGLTEIINSNVSQKEKDERVWKKTKTFSKTKMKAQNIKTRFMKMERKS